MLIDRPVVNLQGGVASVPGESHQVVFAVIDRCHFLHTDVHGPYVESHANFAFLLWMRQNEGTRMNH